jgi:serine/threonine protein kinase
LDEVVKEFGCSLNEAFKNSQAISKALEAQKNNKITLAEMGKKLYLEDFQVAKKLGEGQFGNVFLVSDLAKEQFFALKCISKQETIKSKLEKHLINERQALSTISSPFMM